MADIVGTMLSTSGTAGMTSPDTAGRSERRQFDIKDKIWQVWPERTPFFTLLSRLRKEVTDDPLFKHFEYNNVENVVGKFFLVGPCTWSSTAIGATATNVTVDDGSGNDRYTRFVKGMVVRFTAAGAPLTHRGIAVVTGVDSGGIDLYSLTANSANPADNYEIWITGTAHEEGGDHAASKSDELTPRYGSIQDFRDDWKFSDLMLNTKLFGPDEYNRVKTNVLDYHKLQIDKALIFGKMIRDTANTWATAWGAPKTIDIDGDSTAGNVYTTDGILQLINEYGSATPADGSGTPFKLTFDFNANTYSDWISHSEKIFRFGSPKKLFLVGREAYGAFSKVDKGIWNTGAQTNGAPSNPFRIPMEKGKDTFGVTINHIETPYGDLYPVKCEALRGSTMGLVGIVIDMENVALRVMRNLDTKVDEFEIPKKRIQYGEVRTVCGLQVQNLETHALITFANP